MKLYDLDDLGLTEPGAHGVGGDGRRGPRVLVRVDFNVPLEDGEVMDATRLEQALPTLRALTGSGVRTVLVSHCGRPKGQRDPRYSLRPVGQKLAELLAQDVAFAEDCIGEPARSAVADLPPGGICLLENVRFHAGETGNDPKFAQQLAELADVFVSDAFGTAHRAHASVVGVAELVSKRAAGHLMIREVEALGSLLEEPARPFVGVLGGAKISGKIDTLKNLLPGLDSVLLGGGMANTFLAAQGLDLANSLVERSRLEVAREILALAEASSTRVLLPSDLVVTDDLGNPGTIETVAVGEVPAGTLAVDIGEATRRQFSAECKGAATLFWNGPLGVFEKPPFDAGTEALADSLGGSSGFTVVGGGETVAAVRRAGVADELGHVSTGGGASLAFLAGKQLPGIRILTKGA